jgi:hypothetical protein
MNDNADDMGPRHRVTKGGAKSAGPHKNDAIPSEQGAARCTVQRGQ